MSLARVKTWIAGEVLTATDLNAEFQNILDNAVSLLSPVSGAFDFDGNTITLDAAGATQLVSSTAVSLNITSGAKTGTPGTSGSVQRFSAQTFTDNNTAGSGTATAAVFYSVATPTLAATNASVTTTDAATWYIAGPPTAGTNETITNPWALWVDSGNVRLDGDLRVDGGDITTSATTFNLLNATATTINFGGAATALNLGPAVVCINDTANTGQTVGLTINQGANDNEILSFKSSDVAHGATTVAETDTFAFFQKSSADNGGLNITALNDTGITALANVGVATSADTTKTTSGQGGIHLTARLISGTGVTDVSADGNLVVIRNNATTRFIFDAEGSFHADVESTTYDAHDDLALIEAMDREFQRRNGSPVTEEYRGWLQENRDTLQRLGIVNYYDEGKRCMVNIVKQAQLHNGAIRQLTAMLQDQRKELTAMRAALGVSPSGAVVPSAGEPGSTPGLGV